VSNFSGFQWSAGLEIFRLFSVSNFSGFQWSTGSTVVATVSTFFHLSEFIYGTGMLINNTVTGHTG